VQREIELASARDSMRKSQRLLFRRQWIRGGEVLTMHHQSSGSHRASKRIVLYNPQTCRERSGPPYSRWTEEMPLSLLTIAAWPVHDGYDVVLIDGSRYEPDEAHRRVLEACDGALLYATTGILGYQVADATYCSRKVRARYPELPSFIGGWFASVAPELELASGLYDAVAIGQGEITFREIVQAVDCGAALESVAGLALALDGGVVRTAPRAVVGWDKLLNCPWHLLDVDAYREPQRRESDRNGVQSRFGPGRPRFDISYYASFGCPIQCTFCCSPQVSGMRWKAMSADRMLDDLAGLQQRWGFDGVRFYDANFGVHEKRVRELAEGMLARDVRFAYFPYIQADSIVSYAPSTLDRMAESGFYACLVGAEAGSDDMMARLKKPTRGDENLEAALALDERGVWPLMTYIIGFPDEDAASMTATIEQARRIALACPRARPEVWPFRPIPGTEDFARAVACGYAPPTTLEEWGLVGDYWNDEAWPGRIPSEVSRARRMFMHYSSLAQGRVRERLGLWERRARAHLERNDFQSSTLEVRAFHAYDSIERKLGAMLRPRRRARGAPAPAG
jgi:radical SAM superfamily enzyme YgiQ (UPF0313 family)